MAHSLVTDLAIVLGVAAATGVLFRKLRQPTVLGYLLAGLIVGPYLPVPLFADPERIHELSELGVTLVMFSIGLEFSPRRLLSILPTAGLVAAMQIGSLALLGVSFGRAVGLDTTQSLFVGGAIAISSTMVVAKVFETVTVAAKIRDLVLGILVVQDVVAIALIAVLTGVASGQGLSAEALGTLVLELSATLAGILLVGLVVGVRIVRWLFRVGNAEVTVIAMLALAFCVAVFAEHRGYSVALGAFLAGMVVAESGRGHDTAHQTAPVKDLFAAIFFVSIGMTIDPTLAARHLLPALALSGVIIVGQLAAVTIAGVLTGNTLHRSLPAGAALGQIGEFAFIIVGIGTTSGLLPAWVSAVVVTAAVITSFTTPAILARANRLSVALDHLLPRRLVGLLGLYESWVETLRAQDPSRDRSSRLRRQLVVIGLDVVAAAAIVIGATFAREPLSQAASAMGLTPRAAQIAIPALVALACAPFLAGVVRNAARIGHGLALGLLPENKLGGPDLGQAPRRMLAVTVQTAVVLGAGLPLLALIAPALPPAGAAAATTVLLGTVGIAFWRSSGHVGGHVRAATEVLVEMLQRSQRGEETPEVSAVVPGLDSVDMVQIDQNTELIGQTLADLDLHAQTGAAVLALFRGGASVPTPRLDTRLEAGDILALAGTHGAIARARARLSHAPPEFPADSSPPTDTSGA